MAAWDSVDLDRLVDYRAEYTAVIERHQITGDNLVGLCPFHRDKQNSFSVDLKTGKWHCFSEDEGGNFVTFWAKYHGVDTKQAYKEILEKYGVTPEKKQPKEKGTGPDYAPYSVEQYSFDKHLPVEFLEKTCRASTQRERGGLTCLVMPYLTESKQDLSAKTWPSGSGTAESSSCGGRAAREISAFTVSGGSRKSKKPAGPSWWKGKATHTACGTWAYQPSEYREPPCSSPSGQRRSKG